MRTAIPSRRSAAAGARQLTSRELLARGLRKVRRQDWLPLHLVVVDELAFYLTLADRKQRQEFAELLRDLVARGRAAGVIVVAATQKPGADVVPTSLRDLFGFRLALRCNTPQASDTILGQGWATMGHSAATIAPGPGQHIPRHAHHRRTTRPQPLSQRTHQPTASRSVVEPEASQASARWALARSAIAAICSSVRW